MFFTVNGSYIKEEHPEDKEDEIKNKLFEHYKSSDDGETRYQLAIEAINLLNKTIKEINPHSTDDLYRVSNYNKFVWLVKQSIMYCDSSGFNKDELSLAANALKTVKFNQTYSNVNHYEVLGYFCLNEEMIDIRFDLSDIPEGLSTLY